MKINQQKQQKQYRTDSKEAALFGALCLFFSAIEYLIPKPPFFRFGLANIPLIAALFVLSPRAYVQIVFVKVIGQGIISGSLFSYIFLFSVAGTTASALIMFVLHLLSNRLISCAGISTAGALASNIVQLLLAQFIIFGPGAWIIAFPFLLAGTITSFFTGVGTAVFMERSVWFTAHAYQNTACAVDKSSGDSLVRSSSFPVRTILKLLCAVFLLAMLLFVSSLTVSASVFALSIVILVCSGKRIRVFPIAIMCFGILFLSLFTPAGKVLYAAGPFCITQGSLTAALRRFFTIEGMFFLSRWVISSDFRLPGKAGGFLKLTFDLFASLSAETATIKIVPFKESRLIAEIDRILFKVCGIKTAEDGNQTDAI